MNGEVRVVKDVPSEFAEITATAIAGATGEFRLGASGGNSGRACFRTLSQREDIDFSRVSLYFSDERCVDPTSPDANQKVIGDALGERRNELSGFFPMSCANGPAPYESRLRSAGGFDLLQLGLGPDGHTASLFPGSSGLNVDDGRLVITNRDTFGTNAFDRLTLTFAGIATARLVVITVIGGERAGVVKRLSSGEDLPAARVTAPKVLWLIDEAAAQLLPESARG